jgi:hypothetical protein
MSQHYLVISTPRPEKPSEARANQKAWWDWLNPLVASGVAKHVYTKLGRGAVIIFEVDGPADIHKLVNQWSECVPATFEVEALLPADHQKKIAAAGTNPMKL